MVYCSPQICKVFHDRGCSYCWLVLCIRVCMKCIQTICKDCPRCSLCQYQCLLHPYTLTPPQYRTWHLWQETSTPFPSLPVNPYDVISANITENVPYLDHVIQDNKVVVLPKWDLTMRTIFINRNAFVLYL